MPQDTPTHQSFLRTAPTVVFAHAEDHHYPAVETLRAAGLIVLDAPLVRTVPRVADPTLAARLTHLTDADAVVMTSAAAVRALLAIAPDVTALPRVFYASHGVQSRAHDELAKLDPAIAPAVAQALTQMSVAPPIARAGEVAHLLHRELREGARVVCARAALADDELPTALRAHGFAVEVLTLYDTVSLAPPAKVVTALRARSVVAVLFLSGSCVIALHDAVPDLETLGTALYAIGSKTRRVLEERHLTCAAMPAQPTPEALTRLVLDSLCRQLLRAPQTSRT